MSIPVLSAPQVRRSLPHDIHMPRGRELFEELERQEQLRRLRADKETSNAR